MADQTAGSETPPGAPTRSSSAFEFEFYKLHRAQEVALNTATASYEHSLLRLILLFNAASIAALLGLFTSAGESARITYEIDRAQSAIVAWCSGVALAFIATLLAYYSQRAFSIAYRTRRQALEALLAKPEDPTWPSKFGIVLLTQSKPAREPAGPIIDAPRQGNEANQSEANPGTVAERLRKQSDQHRTQAAKLQKIAIWLGGLAVLAAIVGFVIAITAVRQRTF